jgi:hypothetical protein
MTILDKIRYPALATLPCPNCGTQIANFEVNAAGLPFVCHNCAMRLCVSRFYQRSVKAGCVLLALLVALLLGLHPWFLLLGFTFVVSLVFGAIAGVYVNIFFPPKIEIYVSDDLSLNPRHRQR